MKNKILNILKENKDKLISGTYIADTLNITRSYVSKVIKELIENDFIIETIDRSGYIYRNDYRVLNITKEYISNTQINNVYQLDKIDSTNKFLKDLANKNEDEITLVIANYQTHGRGRLGRTFISNKGKGIYMSILLRPKYSISTSQRITSLVATSVSNAIDKICNVETKIKWVNDIYLNNKKIAGILTEGQTNFESKKVEYIVVGIGINLYHQDFPEELDNIVTTLEDETNNIYSKNELVKEIINQIILYYNHLEENIHITEYRNKSYVINKNVELNIHGIIKHGKVLNIDDDGELIVLIDNKKETIYSGEITKVRLYNE